MSPLDFVIHDDTCRGECALEICEECGGLYCGVCENQRHNDTCACREE